MRVSKILIARKVGLQITATFWCFVVIAKIGSGSYLLIMITMNLL